MWLCITNERAIAVINLCGQWSTMWPGLTNEKALKLRLGLGLVLKGILLQKPVFRQKCKFLELFHCSNIVLLRLLSLFNLQ